MCPTLLQLLTAVVGVNDDRNTSKKGEQHHPGVCTAMAILFKERNREMCGIQTFISLVMFSSHVPKKVRKNHA